MESSIKKEKFLFSDTAKEGLVISIRFVCLFLFLYTAYAKGLDHARFLNGLTKVHIISGFALYISYAVPLAEITISSLLLFPKTAKFGLCGFIGLMTLFTLYIISVLIWEPQLPCHCGGAIEKLSWTQHVWFNLAFIAIAIFAVLLNKSTQILKK